MATQQIEQTRNAWDSLAAGYDQFVTPRWDFAEDVLARVGLRPGMRFLDVACGSGALSVPAARLGAQVLAVDLSPGMIERLSARVRDEGLANVEARVMDGHALDLEDDTYDVSGSQFGVMLFPDLPLGLRELVRVTKPGGQVFLVSYGPPAKVDFLAFFLGALKAVVPGFTGIPTNPPPLPFQVADPEVLRQRLGEAGLNNVRVELSNEPLEFTSGKHMWNWVTNSNPIGRMLVVNLTPDQVATVQQVLDGMLRERSGHGSAVLNNQVNIGIGMK